MNLNDYLHETTKLSFDVILVEPEEQPIYKSHKLADVIGTVGEYVYNRVSVIKIQYVYQKKYGLIKLAEHVLGWTEIEASIELKYKPEETVKFKEDVNEIGKLNKLIGKKVQNINPDQVYLSKHFVEFENRVLEAVYKKDKLMGLISPKDLYHAIEIDKRIELDSSIKLFTSSSLKNEADESYYRDTGIIKTVFPELKIAKLKVSKTYFWIELNSDNLDLPEIVTIDSFGKEDRKYISIVSYFQQEREQSKNIIKKLIEENMQLLSKDSSYQKLQSYKKRYFNLRHSKLGNLQVKYWAFRNRRKKQ